MITSLAASLNILLLSEIFIIQNNGSLHKHHQGGEIYESYRPSQERGEEEVSLIVKMLMGGSALITFLRELKKNKKQRQQVRTAVLKGKNPREIVEELEKIDDMEYNPVTPCPHAPKVMLEKRRKLAETWDRVIKMYEKDQPDQFADLKKLWNNYQARKIEVVKYYESVISAQDVDVDAIPLPTADGGFDGS